MKLARMASLLRMLLVAAALLSSGALQVASAMGEDACCPGESTGQDGPCTECPAGVACVCCPLRVAVTVAPGVIPPAPSGQAVSVACAEPLAGPAVTDIFHPPRA